MAATSNRVMDGSTVSRKAEHIRINVEEDVKAKGISTGFEQYHFVHCALPELDLNEVDSSTSLFGRSLSAPLVISCMTGGTPEAERINHALADAAQEHKLVLGLGSARVLLERPDVLPTFAVRRRAPDVPLLANLGAIQLNKGVTADDCNRIVSLLEADAFVLHLNALQEALQPEGDTNFKGLLSKIEALCKALRVPVIAKEIGWGISADLARQLLDAGVSGIDVAGAGGTSWSEVERHRQSSPVKAAVAAAFADWGIPSATALVDARRIAPGALIIASGGIRDGIDAAKAIALGADLVGLAGPFLRAAAISSERVSEVADEISQVLRILMFVIAAKNLSELKNTSRLQRVVGQTLVTWHEQLSCLTKDSMDFVDITDDVAAAVRRSGVREGIVHIASEHTTAAIRINENEPLLLEDFRALLGRLVPAVDSTDGGSMRGYGHNDLERRHDVRFDEPRNGHAHCQHLLLSSGESVPVAEGSLQLGAWQRVFLIELDAPRRRRVNLQVIGQ